jgi:chromosome segregation protein
VAAAVKGARARVRVVPEDAVPLPPLAQGVQGPDAALRTLSVLLGEVEVRETAADALAAWRHGLRVVARDGALVRPDGVLLVGQADAAAGTAALRRRRELAALREQLEGQDAAVAARQDAVTAARQALEAAQARVTELQRAVTEAGRAGEAAVEAARAELRGREALVGEARDRLRVQEGEATRQKQAAAQLATEAAQIARDRAAVLDEGARAAAAVESAEAQHQQAEEAARQAQRELEVHEPAARAAAERLASLRAEAGNHQREVAGAGDAERSATTRAQRAAARVELVAKERTDLEQRLATLALESVSTSANLQSLGEKLGEVRMQLDGLRGTIATEREKARGLETTAKTARDARDTAKDTLHRHEARLAQVRAELDRVRGDVEARYELSLPALLDRIDRDGQLLLEGHTPPPDAIGGEVVPTLRVTPGDLTADVGPRAEALREAREAFLKIGEVNLEAEDEYREVAARHGDIEKQRADLLEAMDIIEKAIAKINRTCRERFRETFDQVSEHYAEIYPRLTGGGVGRLQLTDEEDLLVAGVEMFAQPPGKKVQNLALLSGGEKALAAIALIFALFRVKPSPFCLLDEVDAPLDEGNGGRFNEMLKEMSRSSQFIIITHNKKTMEAADVLYGVTMPEPGVSRLVTVRMDG